MKSEVINERDQTLNGVRLRGAADNGALSGYRKI